MDADEFDWAWQEMRLQVQLRDIDGDAFETLFQNIGKAIWGSAFDPTIPMGRRGDLKCDGWRGDVGYVYQCYGPRYGQADVNEALKKVEEEFQGSQGPLGRTAEQVDFRRRPLQERQDTI